MMSINLLVLVFNLIPGFPLDGGRIARAIAWKLTGDRNKATRFAGVLGRGFGWLLIAGGAALFISGSDAITGVWFAFIGFFLAQAAKSAVEQANFSDRIGDIRVADVMDAEPVCDPRDLHGRGSGGRRLPALRLGLVPGGRRERPTRGRGLSRSARERAGGAAREPAGRLGDGARRRRERPANRPRGAARVAARPGGPCPARGDVAVDRDGVLRGVVTIDSVRRAHRAATGRPPRGAPLHRIAAASRMPQHDVLVIGGRPRRPACRPRRRGGGGIRGDHLQGPPGALALERRTGRHQRGARPAGLVGVARLRHRQGLGLPGRPGRDRDHVP